jgi:hypothetical protein
MNRRRLLLRILNGSRNVRFSDFVDLIEGFGFRLSRVQGSHHIFVHPVVAELVNVQNVYHLRLSDDADEPEVSP